MSAAQVGQPAPSFRLPTAEGSEIALDDYRGERNVIVWFTKGMACSFCRQHMSQLARGYPRFRELGAEVLEITVSPPSRARLYARKYTLPFPYLCDPDYRVRREWGLDARSHSPLWYLNTFLAASRGPQGEPTEFGSTAPDFLQMHRLLADEDAGLFIVDRQGIVRYGQAGVYADEQGPKPIPPNEEIERELARL